MKPKLLDYVKIVDSQHKDFGKSGQLTDFDIVDQEYVLHFDELTENQNVYWTGESTRVKAEQVERITKFGLKRRIA